MELADRLIMEHGLTNILQFKLMTKGNTSNTYFVSSLIGENFILKSINSIDQALFEYELNSHIIKCFPFSVPKILLNINRLPYFVFENQVFQLQIYQESIKQRPPLKKWVQAYQGLTNALQTFESSYPAKDRFSLQVLWPNWQGVFQVEFPSIYAEFENDIERLLELDVQRDVWIHGDLGNWNALFTPNNEVVWIDFSEARLGPKYFDLAALLTSYIPANREIEQYIKEFICIYNERDQIDGAELKDTIRLWYIRGILVALKNKMNHSVIHFFDRMYRSFSGAFR